MPDTIVTRFAPSPSGDLHLGHVYSAWLIEQFAQEQRELGMTVSQPLLRWEDIDHTRCSRESEQSITEDLQWLGLSYHQSEPVLRQSERLDIYAQALDQLIEMDVVYPCFCTRKQIRANIELQVDNQIDKITDNATDSIIDSTIDNMLNAPQVGMESTPHYAGTCLKLLPEQRAELLASDKPYAWRLNTQKARAILEEQLGQDGKELYFDDLSMAQSVQVDWSLVHDDVLARKELKTSYHLAVIIDDDEQHITHAIRGEDLRETTHLHRVLQQLLKLRTPTYIHHPLLYNEQGKRLSKRDQSTTIKQLKTQHPTAQQLIHHAQTQHPTQWQSLKEIVKRAL